MRGGFLYSVQVKKESVADLNHRNGEKDLTPYLIIGFVLAAYAGQAITMVGITLIAFAIAMIIYQIRSNQGTVVQSASTLDDEWED